VPPALDSDVIILIPPRPHIACGQVRQAISSRHSWVEALLPRRSSAQSRPSSTNQGRAQTLKFPPRRRCFGFATSLEARFWSACAVLGGQGILARAVGVRGARGSGPRPRHPPAGQRASEGRWGCRGWLDVVMSALQRCVGWGGYAGFSGEGKAGVGGKLLEREYCVIPG